MFDLGVPQTARVPLIDPTPRPKLLVLSASDSESVKAGAQEHAQYAESHVEALEDMAYTLACRREHDPWRAFAVANGTSSTAFSSPSRAPAAIPDVVLVFTGQGAQWPSMGAKLLSDFPSVAHDLRLMDSALSMLGPGLAPTWNFAGITPFLIHVGESPLANHLRVPTKQRSFPRQR